MASLVCKTCGETHDSLPSLMFSAPTPYALASPEDRAEHWDVEGDFAVYKESEFFVRAMLLLPIKDTDQSLTFGCWSSLSKDNFTKYFQKFEDDDQSTLGPMFSYFMNAVPGYSRTLGLNSDIIPQDDRMRPLIWLHDFDHPLVQHQRDGISMNEATTYFHTHVSKN